MCCVVRALCRALCRGSAKWYQSKLGRSTSLGVSTCSSRVFDASGSGANAVSHPLLRVLWATANGHNAQYGDGGLFSAALTAGLLRVGLSRITGADDAVGAGAGNGDAVGSAAALHPTIVISALQLAQHWALQFLDATHSSAAAAKATDRVRAPVACWRWNDMQSVLSVVRSVVTPKLRAAVIRVTSRAAIDALCVSVVQAFLTALPPLPPPTPGTRVTVPSPAVRLLSVESAPSNADADAVSSSVFDGVVLDVGLPAACPVRRLPIAAPADATANDFGDPRASAAAAAATDLRVVCYNCNLTFDARDAAHTVPVFRVHSNGTAQHLPSASAADGKTAEQKQSKASDEAAGSKEWTADGVAVAQMQALCERWHTHGVRVVWCQKVVHPYLKHLCLSRAIVCVERLSIRHMDAVHSVCGGAVLTATDPNAVSPKVLGACASIEERLFGGTKYLFVAAPNAVARRSTHPVVTLICHARDAHSAQELTRVVSSALAVVRVSLANTYASSSAVSSSAAQADAGAVMVCAGGGVTEYLLAQHLRQCVRHACTANAAMQQNNTRPRYRRHDAVLSVVQGVASEFERIACAIAFGAPLTARSTNAYGSVAAADRKSAFARALRSHAPSSAPAAADAADGDLKAAAFADDSDSDESTDDDNAAAATAISATDTNAWHCPRRRIGQPLLQTHKPSASPVAGGGTAVLFATAWSVVDSVAIKRSAVTTSFETAAMLLRADAVIRDVR